MAENEENMNENPAQNAPETVATPPQNEKEDIEKTMQEAQKTRTEEAAEIARYPGLKLVIQFAKVIGIILAVIFFLLAFIQLFVADGWGDKFIGFLACLGLALIFGAVGYSIGDFLQVFIDIEENTRKKKN